MSTPFEAFFHDVGRGRDPRRFCIHHPPAGDCRAAVLHVSAFAEEMNKSRRMVALQSQAFARAGFAVLRPDLEGCGDSGGDFAEASWDGWLQDIASAIAWLQARHPGVPLWLWGLRAGCLLASAAAARLPASASAPAPAHLLFWQPPASGKPLLQQFLRLRVAAQLADGGGKGLLEGLRAELAAGRSVSVAGYQLPPALALGLEQARLLPPQPGQHVRWLELGPRAGAELLPASAALLQGWPAQGTVRTAAVVGPSFWQTTEIEDAPALLQATLALLADAPGLAP